jgi:hypothetical protein
MYRTWQTVSELSRRWGILTVAALVVALGSHHVSIRAGAEDAAPVRKSRGSVTGAANATEKARQALLLGIFGNAKARQTLLREATELDPQLALARWHLAQVRDGERWMSVEQYESLRAVDGTLAEYDARRAQVDNDPARELSLASWCAAKGLQDTAQVHWQQLLQNPLASAAQRDVAIEKLGLQSYEGVLRSRDEIERLHAEQAKHDEQLAKWVPLLERWRDGLQSNSARRERAVRDELNQLSDPAAVAALEQVFSSASEPLALEAINVLGRIPEHEATQSLVNHALHLPWESAREAAIEQLRTRSPHDFLPLMLNQLVSTMKTQTEVYVGPDGMVHRHHHLHQEGAEADRVLTTSFVGGPQFVVTGTRNIVGAAKPGRDGEAARRALRDVHEKQAGKAQMAQVIRQLTFLEQSKRALAVEQDVAKRNAMIEAQNASVFQTLETVTGQALPAIPTAWWEWWSNHNELYQESKPVERYYLTEQERFYIPMTYVTRSSCFAAGTKVRTETGLRPIEQVKPGDRVLSQDMETGELAYQPVLYTTTRPPSELLHVELDDATIVTTKGHPIWVNHVGWRMAKELVPGQQVHSLGGGQTVRDVRQQDRAEAYNLVVQDFATYFVTDAGVLVHDNTMRQPTQTITPGLLQP